MTIYYEILYIPFTLFLAGKDATSYLLKSRNDDSLSYDRVKRWHRDGFIIALIAAIMCILGDMENWWFLMIAFILERAAFFDLAFNKWANLDIEYLGGTSITDKALVSFFGKNGAVRKSILAFLLLLIFNYIFRGRL